MKQKINKFGERIKQLRVENNLTQDVLSERINISQSAISVWESSLRVPSALIVIEFSIFFNVSSDYLLGITDDKKWCNYKKEDIASLSERIKELRLQMQLTQSELAKRTGLLQSSIAYWEIGKNVPDSNKIIILAEFFDVSTDYLLGLSDNMN